MKKQIYIATLVTCLLFVEQAYSQIKTLTNTAVGGTEYVGWDGTGGNNTDLYIENHFPNQNIVLSTNPNSSGTTVTPKMTILGNNGATDGFVGIGAAFTNPAARLHVLESVSGATSGNIAGYVQNASTSSTNNLLKLGLFVQSTGTWNGGTNSVNVGLNVLVGGGAENYSALFNGGDVGIGTSAPAYALEVNGTVAAKQILVEQKNGTHDLLALLTKLRSEVEELKQQICFSAKN